MEYNACGNSTCTESMHVCTVSVIMCYSAYTLCVFLTVCIVCVLRVCVVCMCVGLCVCVCVCACVCACVCVQVLCSKNIKIHLHNVYGYKSV